MTYKYKDCIDEGLTAQFFGDFRYHKKVTEEWALRITAGATKYNGEPERWWREFLNDKWTGTAVVWRCRYGGSGKDVDGNIIQENAYYLTTDRKEAIDLFEQWIKIKYPVREPADPLAVFDIWD